MLQSSTLVLGICCCDGHGTLDMAPKFPGAAPPPQSTPSPRLLPFFWDKRCLKFVQQWGAQPISDAPQGFSFPLQNPPSSRPWPTQPLMPGEPCQYLGEHPGDLGYSPSNECCYYRDVCHHSWIVTASGEAGRRRRRRQTIRRGSGVR